MIRFRWAIKWEFCEILRFRGVDYWFIGGICVTVGNIPYDATEEQLIEICQEVGPVVSFRFVFVLFFFNPKTFMFWNLILNFYYLFVS
jgi:hypothetical protein